MRDTNTLEKDITHPVHSIEVKINKLNVIVELINLHRQQQNCDAYKKTKLQSPILPTGQLSSKFEDIISLT
jgi:hypothetical protein